MQWAVRDAIPTGLSGAGHPAPKASPRSFLLKKILSLIFPVRGVACSALEFGSQRACHASAIANETLRIKI